MVDEVDPRDEAVKAGIVGNDGDEAAIQHLLQFLKGCSGRERRRRIGHCARDFVTEVGWVGVNLEQNIGLVDDARLPAWSAWLTGSNTR